MRLDKYLANSGLGTRKHIKKAIRSGVVFIDGQMVKDETYDVDPAKEKVSFNGKELTYHESIYILMNKPQGYLCSTIDELYPSVLNILEPSLQKRARIVGRLDVDTTGVLLITDNGKLNNRLIHPKAEVEKEYQAELNHPISDEIIATILSKGIQLDDDTLVKPLSITKVKDDVVRIIVKEGKYHEIKRIFHRFGLEVINLDRVRLGFLTYGDLKPGEYRDLSEKEIQEIENLAGTAKEEEKDEEA